jgi:hypothetical protein
MRGLLLLLADVQHLLLLTAAAVTVTITFLVLDWLGRRFFFGLCDVGIGLGAIPDEGGLNLGAFGEGRFRVSLTFEQRSGFVLPLILLALLVLLGVAFHLLEDVVELLIGRLVVGVVSPVPLQEVFAHLQLLLDVRRD